MLAVAIFLAKGLVYTIAEEDAMALVPAPAARLVPVLQIQYAAVENAIMLVSPLVKANVQVVRVHVVPLVKVVVPDVKEPVKALVRTNVPILAKILVDTPVIHRVEIAVIRRVKAHAATLVFIAVQLLVKLLV